MELESSNAFLETRVSTGEEWYKKHHSHSRLAYVKNKIVLRWKALAPFFQREVFEGVAEVSVYKHLEYSGKGIGTQIIQELRTSSEKNYYGHCFLVYLQRTKRHLNFMLNLVFKHPGSREKIAQLDGIWRDTQIFERRSNIVNID